MITVQIPFHKSYLDGNNEMHWLKCHTCISTMWVIFIYLLFGTLCIHECTDFICFIFITMLFPLRWLLRPMGLSITFSLISIKMRKKLYCSFIDKLENKWFYSLGTNAYMYVTLGILVDNENVWRLLKRKLLEIQPFKDLHKLTHIFITLSSAF